MKTALIVWGLLYSVTAIFSQNFGGNPPSIKWQQLNTDTVRVIYPQGFEKQAQRLVNCVHYINRNNTRSISSKMGKVDIVLQAYTTIPNGYVAIAPLRSEFFVAPPQDPYTIGTMNWIDALAIHEYRHVLQNYNARVGLTRLAYILQGEIGWAVLSGLSLPNWFFEGDAVVTETALSNSGRGRLPYFTLEQRALFLNNKNYRYIKARNGSYKDLLPNHYPLGYAICTYGRKHFGNDCWKTVLADAARYKGIFFPFSHNLKKQTGLTVTAMYNAAYKEADIRYKDAVTKLQLSATSPVNKFNKGATVTNYEYPYFINDSTLLCIKNSYKKTYQFITITNNGEERKLLSKGLSIDPYYTYKNGKLAWTELAYDPRWTNRNYSEIITYDLNTRKKRRLTHLTNYFSPEFSAKGDQLVVVSSNTKKEFILTIINAATGKVVKTLPNPDNLFLLHPKWTADDKAIIVISQRDSKLAFLKYNLDTGVQEQLTDYTSQVITNPFIKADTVYFSSGISGIDNIYAFKIGEKNIYQVTSVKLGAYQPALANSSNTITFAEFTLMGYDISKMTLHPSSFKIAQFIEPLYSSIDSISTIEGGNILDKIPTIIYPEKKYTQLAHVINVHSWEFIAADKEYGLMLLSQNILNTVTGNLSTYYNGNDNRLNSSFNIAYAGLYPVINLGAGKTTDLSARKLKTNENYLYTGLSIPLTFTRGLYQRQLTVSSTAFYRHVVYAFENLRFTRNISTIETKLSFSNLRIKAYQNIYSRFGQTIYASYSSTFGKNITQLSVAGKLFLPGLSTNHNLILESAYQKKVTDNFAFADNFSYPRGYTRPFYNDIFKVSVNYHLPLLYPDIGINGIVYLKRIRLNLFYDYGLTNVSKYADFHQLTLSSFGAEATFDTNILNTLPLSLGVRVAALLNRKQLFSAITERTVIEFFLAMHL